MALKIRLRQQGRANRQFYRLVVTDSRAPRDGAYLEMLGWYNPYETEQEKNTSVNAERVLHWLDLGAQLSDKAEALVHRAVPAVAAKNSQRLVERREKARAKRKQQKKAA